jgi:hypothetical protein
MLKLVMIALAAIVILFAAFVVVSIGPRNVIGMIRYDRRQEGKLKVGDPAPNVALVALDGASGVPLLAKARTRPLVLVFGSFT